MYLYKYTYTFTYIYICIYVYMSIHVHMYMYISLHTYPMVKARMRKGIVKASTGKKVAVEIFQDIKYCRFSSTFLISFLISKQVDL